MSPSQTKSRLIIVGDSHVDALHKAHSRHPESLVSYDVSILKLSKVKQGKVFGDIRLDDVELLLGETTTDDVLVSVIGGNLFHMLSLVRPAEAFQLFGATNTCPIGTPYIPRNCFKAELSSLMEQKELPQLRRLANAAPGRVLHVSAPPPRTAADTDMKALSKKFPEIARTGLNSDALRMEAWRLQCELQAETCRELGIPFLAPPPKTLIETGFLRPKLFAADTTHANIGYGTYVLNQIRDVLYASTSSTAISEKV